MFYEVGAFLLNDGRRKKGGGVQGNLSRKISATPD